MEGGEKKGKAKIRSRKGRKKQRNGAWRNSSATTRRSVPAEAQSSSLSSHVGQVTNADLSLSSGLLYSCTHTHTHTETHNQKQNK